MNTRQLRLLLCGLFSLLLAAPRTDCHVRARGAEKPNILLIMADDIGIEGLGCYGGASYLTPHLDSLASQGIRFTRAYAQPLCTPTRVQLMTGKYNHRNWQSFGILDPTEKTIGHFMKEGGYATGIFGKWQLQSYDPPELPNSERRRGTGMHPMDAGFDEFALFHALHTEDKGSRYANPTMLEGRAKSAGTLKTYHGRYGEDVWVEKIVSFFDRHRNEPAFVYYPMALPHTPFELPPDSPDWNPENNPEGDVRFITDMVQYMDTIVGNLLKQLETNGLRNDTLVLFYSDNGTHRSVTSRMKDGRSIPGGKSRTTQTGIHVPLIANWPGRIQPGICGDIVDASDILPSILEIAGANTTGRASMDGVSFAPQLLGRAGQPREWAFFWYDPRPGWDKERYSRHVFALNKTHKLFQNGRLYRLTDTPLQEQPVDPLRMTAEDRTAYTTLMGAIQQMTSGQQIPPLVNAYGEPEQDLLYVPANRQETSQINQQLLATGKEIAYGDPAITEQRLWIFNPLDIQPDELRPCVFFIHGGGWGGSPAALAPQSVYLQRRGWNAVSIHFRAPRNQLTPKDTLRDARLAWNWIVKHGAHHHIDVDRMVVSGGSAGGHLALALSTISLDNDPVTPHLPRAYVLFNPAIDLVDGWKNGRQRCIDKGMDPRMFSPAHHIRPGLPPTLVLSGSKDQVIPPELVRGFQTRMRQSGNRCKFIEYPDAAHGFFNYGRESNRYFQWTMWALEDYLKEVGL